MSGAPDIHSSNSDKGLDVYIPEFETTFLGGKPLNAGVDRDL